MSLTYEKVGSLRFCDALVLWIRSRSSGYSQMMTTIEHRSETCREVLRVYSLKSGAMRPMLGRSAGT